MEVKKGEIKHPREPLKPVSLNHLSPEEALSAFMQADAEKVEERLKDQGVKKDKK